MPAKRSRTENWRRSLEQLHERGGALEITLPRYVDDKGNTLDGSETSNLIWRVRILELHDDRIVLERPMALGKPIDLQEGVGLVAIIAIGQNRWMFRTTHRGKVDSSIGQGKRVVGITIDAPESVERCQRRNFYRVETIGLDLPRVTCYPLMDTASAPLAEAASRSHFEAILRGGNPDAELLLPEVGPKFNATLMNLGGGGAGLLVEPDERQSAETKRNIWMSIDLRPFIPAPICISARQRHTHIDSQQRLYVGVSFEFEGREEHEKFVVDQLCRYVAEVQREQLRRSNTGKAA